MKPIKNLGQNFLIDNYKILEIITLINPTHDMNFVEVGPGMGALTLKLAPKANSITAIEIDKRMSLFLEDKKLSNLIIKNLDFLDFDLNQLKNNEYHFVSNLPYYIATPILFKAMEFKKFITINFMIQKELAERILSKPNNKSYGRITVMINTFFYDLQKIFIPAESFNPIPQVDSIFLKMKRKKIDLSFKEYAFFIKACFAYKRKTLINSLKLSKFKKLEFVVFWLEENNFDKKIRSEQLLIENYIELFRFLNQN